MHSSIQEDEIKNTLKGLCHEVIHVWNIKQKKMNTPLPMFFHDLKPSDNNIEIYNIRRLSNLVVRVEAPYIKQEIPQCTHCQQHGHKNIFAYDVCAV